MGIWGTSKDRNHSVIFSCLSVTFYCCSGIQSCQTHCDPMDYSMPHFPVLHYFPKFPSTYVCWVDDVIQPSHPLSPPSPPALHLSQHQERLSLLSASFASSWNCWVSLIIGIGSWGQSVLWNWGAEDVRGAYRCKLYTLQLRFWVFSQTPALERGQRGESTVLLFIPLCEAKNIGPG